MRHAIPLAAALALAACSNTAQGIKEDVVKRAGRVSGSAIERSGGAIERTFEGK